MLSKGFEKVAGGAAGLAAKGMNALSTAAKEAPGIAKATAKGMSEGAEKSVSHHLKLRGFSDAMKHVQDAGGAGKAMGSAKGRRMLGQAAGKALPSAVAGGAYLGAAKKVYDSALGDKPQGQSAGNYYGGY
jgi:hypothetical protein